ncbi:hypothetical protein C8R44DRAFT_736175 [Mycena epipterygia]|nr:hypothetical protein C8R44DRAFT_736175 [Mycena epipterygia]
MSPRSGFYEPTAKDKRINIQSPYFSRVGPSESNAVSKPDTGPLYAWVWPRMKSMFTPAKGGPRGGRAHEDVQGRDAKQGTMGRERNAGCGEREHLSKDWAPRDGCVSTHAAEETVREDADGKRKQPHLKTRVHGTTSDFSDSVNAGIVLAVVGLPCEMGGGRGREH